MSIEHSNEQNLQKEIKGHQEAAEVFKRSGSFLEYSRTLLLMGNAYLSLSKIREPEGDLESAIKAYKGALRTLTKKDHPTDYVAVQNNLGRAYNRLAQFRDKEDNIKLAIGAFKKALTTRNKKGQQIDYAHTQNIMGVSYVALAEVRDSKRNDSERNLKLAIEAFKGALTIFAKKDHQVECAVVNENLGNAYLVLATVRDRKENLELAVQTYNEALTVCTEESNSERHKRIMGIVDIVRSRLKKEHS